MPVRTFWFTAGGSTGYPYELIEVQPANETAGTGWTVGKLSPPLYSLIEDTVERPTTALTSTVEPDTTGISSFPYFINLLGSAFEDRFTGTFDAGTWNFYINVIAVSNGGAQDGRFRMRVYKGPNSGGSGATELTTSTLVTTSFTNLTTSTVQGVSVSWDAPAFSLSSEFIFIAFAFELTGAGGGNSSDVLLRAGNEINGCKIVSTNFETGLAASGSVGTVNVSGPEATITMIDATLYQRTTTGVGR